VRNGLKDVQKRIRKGERGIVIFAGDITPIDIMCHLPGVCEDNDIPYVYVPSRKDLGAAMGIMRGCMTVLVRSHDDYKEIYNELKEEITNLGVAL
jgi:H/ACA ribonucleoprotein complex subunit 2